MLPFLTHTKAQPAMKRSISRKMAVFFVNGGTQPNCLDPLSVSQYFFQEQRALSSSDTWTSPFQTSAKDHHYPGTSIFDFIHIGWYCKGYRQPPPFLLPTHALLLQLPAKPKHPLLLRGGCHAKKFQVRKKNARKGCLASILAKTPKF